MNIFIELYIRFFKTGLFSVGGGMATLPFLYEMSEDTGWFTVQQLTDMVALSESTPGPIGVNMATYVGYATAGFLGGVVSTLGLITPEIIVILLISKIYKQFKSNSYVQSAFLGLRPCSIALICSALYFVAGVTFCLDTGINMAMVIFAVFLFLIMRYVPKIKNIHPVFFILFSAFIGIIFKF